MSGKLGAALAWAARGFRVFPLQQNSKNPTELAWTLHATTDPAIIETWWRDPVTGFERDLNIGFLTTDWIVPDVDVKDGKPGLETFFDLGMDFDTLCMMTPTGGYHLVYQGIDRLVGGSPLGDGVDVRSHNGYVVAPGSTIDGKAYTIAIDIPIAPFPTHLRDKLKSPRDRAASLPTNIELDTPELIALVAHWASHDAPPAVEGANGDDTTYRVACRMRDFGLSEQAAYELFVDEYNPRCSPPWSPEEARAKIENAYRYATGEIGNASPEAAFGHAVAVEVSAHAAAHQLVAPYTAAKPVIQIKINKIHIVATLGEAALLASTAQIYQRGETLVRPIISEVEASEGRRTTTAQLLKIESAYMRDVLRREVSWCKWDGRSKGLVAADVPAEVAISILARQGEWIFPAIAGVISCPTLRPDGSILDQSGFDPVTRLLLVGLPPMPPIPAEPTFDDAMRALALLKGLLVEFPFIGNVDRAVALSALITPVVRGAFRVTPMHCASAPAAGSGKSFLFDTTAAIATGQVMPVMSAGASEEELEKRLGAALMTGQPLISIDNVNGVLRGDALCQAIERPLIEIRILGRSEKVKIEGGGTSITCNGNNIILHGDLNRRTITALMDSGVDRPELREFKDDPFTRVLADRGAYIAAALTICRAYFVAGRPGKVPPLASFGGWSDTVRSALIWLGEADPVSSQETMRRDDPETAEITGMLEAWVEVFGTGYKFRRSLADVVAIASRWPRLNAAIQSVAARGRDSADVTNLGAWLRRFRDRFVENLRFVNDAGKKPRHISWWVESKTGESAEGALCRHEQA